MSLECNETGWTRDLETGISVLDLQHRRYFELLNNYLEHANDAPTDSAKVVDLAEKLNFLRQYAHEHFSTEESVMVESSYPDMEDHKEEHRHFMRHIGELYNKLRVFGYSPGLAREVTYYTAEWFIEHIRVTDMKFVEFLNHKSTEDKNIPIFLKKISKSLFGNE